MLAAVPSASIWNEDIKQRWTTAYDSMPGEFEYEVDDIEGTIPADLCGSVWRNGPGNFERGGERYAHVLDGDGLICRISLDGASGRASFKSRFVRTPDFEAEEAADTVLRRNTFGTQPEGGWLSSVGRLTLKNVANTNVVKLGGKLLALWEAGLPVRLDPSTLDCMGEDTLDGLLVDGGMTVGTGWSWVDRLLGLGEAFTAHPRAEGGTGRLAGFSWASKLDQSAVLTTIREWDQASGKLLDETRLELACPVAPHDFGLTDEWYVFAHNSMALDVYPFIAGFKGPVDCLRTTGGGVTLQLVRRPRSARRRAREQGLEQPAAPEQLVVPTGDPYFAIHHANAFDEVDETGAVTRLFTAGWPVVADGPFLGDWGGDVPLYDGGAISPTQLFETVIRHGGGGASVEKRVLLGGACIDHPHVDPRFEGKPSARYFYMSYCNREGESGSPPVGWLRYDRLSGEEVVWKAPHGCFCEEVVVIPKRRGAAAGAAAAGAAAEAEEDVADAWFVAMMYDSGRRASCLAVLDCADLGKGPVAKVWMRHHVPHGLHGCWEPESLHGLASQ